MRAHHDQVGVALSGLGDDGCASALLGGRGDYGVARDFAAGHELGKRLLKLLLVV
jgi:hypothetical protein